MLPPFNPVLRLQQPFPMDESAYPDIGQSEPGKRVVKSVKLKRKQDKAYELKWELKTRWSKHSFLPCPVLVVYACCLCLDGAMTAMQKCLLVGSSRSGLYLWIQKKHTGLHSLTLSQAAACSRLSLIDCCPFRLCHGLDDVYSGHCRWDPRWQNSRQIQSRRQTQKWWA